MKVLVCGTCHRIIKQHEPFWQAFYSKQVFCCASCAAIAQGCTRYVSGETYDKIFMAQCWDEKAWETIRANLDSPSDQQLAKQMRSESTDYRFDLDF